MALTTGPFATLTGVANECGVSRVYAGVHFIDAVRAPVQMCRQVAARVFQAVVPLVQG